jgi:hypothetical protein
LKNQAGVSCGRIAGGPSFRDKSVNAVSIHAENSQSDRRLLFWKTVQTTSFRSRLSLPLLIVVPIHDKPGYHVLVPPQLEGIATDSIPIFIIVYRRKRDQRHHPNFATEASKPALAMGTDKVNPSNFVGAKIGPFVGKGFPKVFSSAADRQLIYQMNFEQPRHSNSDSIRWYSSKKQGHARSPAI